MNKTPLQIAEELARKCALEMFGWSARQDCLSEDHQARVDSTVATLLDELPLVQLLECARLLKSCEWVGALLTSDKPPLLGGISQALYNLDKRL